MIPRAGRRASQAPQAFAAIDPLEPPPSASSGPSWLDDDSAAPPQDLGATTMGTPPPVISTLVMQSAPAPASWLDDDVAPSRTATPRAASPMVVLHQMPAQAAVVQPLHPADLSRARSATPQSETAPSTAFPAPTVTALSNTSYSGGRTTSPQRHLTPPSQQLLGNAPSPAMSPSMRMDSFRSPQTGVVHPPPAAAAVVTVVFDDHASVLATLERELAETDKAIDDANTVIGALDGHTHALSTEVQHAANQATSAEAQLRLATDAVALMRGGFEDRRAALALRRQAALESIEATVTAASTQTAEQQIRSLEAVIGAQAQTISGLQLAVKDTVLTITDDAQHCNQAALVELSARMVDAFRDDRAALKLRSKGILEEETRVVMAETTSERGAMIEADRSARSKAIQNHKDQRHRQFELFRARAKDERQLSADRLFGGLKLRMERFGEEVRQRSRDSLETFRTRIAEDDVRTHREANAHVEQLLKRQHADAVTFDSSCERSVKELNERLAAFGNHERRMHDAAIESATRLLNETVRSTTSDPSRDTFDMMSTMRKAEGIAVNHASLEHLRAMVASLSHGIEEATHTASLSLRRSEESEVAKLILEREAVLHELGRETTSQKLRLDNEWKRLETGLLDLGAKADAFEKSTRQGRVTLIAAQSKLDQVRSCWEQEGRRALHATIGDGGNGGMGLLQDHPVTAVMFDIGCNLTMFLDHHRRLCKQRRVEAQGVDAVDRELAQRREACAAATMGILQRFETLSELSAKVELKQSTVKAEMEDVVAAKGDVDRMRASFEAGVTMAKDVADRLRHVSAVVNEQQKHVDQQMHQRGYSWRHAPLDFVSAPRDNTLQQRGSAVRDHHQTRHIAARHPSESSSSTSESKYRHLYQQPSLSAQHHHATHDTMPLRHRSGASNFDLTAGTAQESRNYSAVFQSLIPLDPTESYDQRDDDVSGAGGVPPGHYRAGVAALPDGASSSFHNEGRRGELSIGSHRTARRADADYLLPADGAAAERGSSQSTARSGAGRSSLPTPSSDSGPPL